MSENENSKAGTFMEYVPKEETFFEEFYNDLKEYQQLRVLVIIVGFFTIVFCCVGFR